MSIFILKLIGNTNFIIHIKENTTFKHVSFFLKMVLSLFVLKYYPIAPGRINAKITVKLIIEIDIII